MGIFRINEENITLHWWSWVSCDLRRYNFRYLSISDWMSLRVCKGERPNVSTLGDARYLQRVHKSVPQKHHPHDCLLHLGWLLQKAHQDVRNQDGAILRQWQFSDDRILDYLAVWSTQKYGASRNKRRWKYYYGACEIHPSYEGYWWILSRNNTWELVSFL